MQWLCYSEFAVILYNCGLWGWVMRKNQTTLTYKPLKEREKYQMIKKIFWGKKNPVRLLYNEVYGTETSPWDEISYICVCLCETVNIVGLNVMKQGSHYMKKIFQYKK